MINEKADGPFKQYSEDVGQLAVKLEFGEDISERLEALVKKAMIHLRGMQSSSPDSNVAAFKSALKWESVKLPQTRKDTYLKAIKLAEKY